MQAGHPDIVFVKVGFEFFLGAVDGVDVELKDIYRRLRLWRRTIVTLLRTGMRMDVAGEEDEEQSVEMPV